MTMACRCKRVSRAALKIFTVEDIAKIQETVQSWKTSEGYEDVAGFCKSASLDEIEKNGFVLTPGRYVGADLGEISAEDFSEKFRNLKHRLDDLKESSSLLDQKIDSALRFITYD